MTNFVSGEPEAASAALAFEGGRTAVQVSEGPIEEFRPFALSSMLWPARYLAPSAWVEHVPFAFWIVDALRPRVVVELGSHYGTSYFAFCQAVERLGLDARCYAVDTWKGDDQAGFYGEEVFQKVSAHNTNEYSAFSNLLRSTFDDALPHFADGSIDLLHIDGHHTFESVRHDFETWLPKLSPRAVVLFHDTNVRWEKFGVARYFNSLREKYPAFEFHHGHGLGVLSVGGERAELVKRLVEVDDRSAAAQSVRHVFSRLGRSCSEALTAKELKAHTGALQGETASLRAQLEGAHQALHGAQEAQRTSARQVADLMLQLEVLDARNAGSRGQLAERITALEEIRGNLIQSAAVHKEQSDALVADLRGRLQVLENETGRLTREHGEAVAELGVRREEVQRLSGELGGAQARLGELENERGELMRGLSELSSEVARLRQSADDLQRLVVEGESALAAARNEKEDLLLEVARLQTTAQLTAKERDALKQNVEERFRELAQLTRMIQERDRALAEKEAAHLKSQQALERASQTRVAALENERNTLQHSVNERFRELAHLTQMLLHRDVALEDARAAAQKMKQSFSWKVSAPVRWLGRALGGGSSVRRRLAKQKALLEQSGLFDAAWYRSTYPDVVESGQDPAAHYLRHGAKEGRNPGPKFDTQNYLKRYPDVSKAEPAINPLLHYVLHGQKEGRSLS
jgi:hypothetical protein